MVYIALKIVIAMAVLEAILEVTTANIFTTKYGKNTENGNVCHSDACRNTAETVLKYIDTSVDPCEDFYKFTCGNFVNTTKVPNDQFLVSNRVLLESVIQTQLHSLFEAPIEPDELRAFRLVKKLYKACTNVRTIEKDGLETMHDVLRQLGGWPILEGKSWRQSDFDWQRSMVVFQKFGLRNDFLIQFSIEIDPRNTSKHVISLHRPSLVMDHQLLVGNTFDPADLDYYNLMKDVASHFGANGSYVSKELFDALHFETQLASISFDEVQQIDMDFYIPMTIGELQNNYSSVNWMNLVDGLLRPDLNVTSDEVVLVYAPKYLTEFAKLIGRTSKRTQANYVIWRGVLSYLKFLNAPLRNQFFSYTFKLGEYRPESRWKECTTLIRERLPLATGALYVRNYFKENSREIVQNIVETILEEFESVITKIDWMDYQTKEQALDKAKAIESHVGYPNELLVDNILEEYYSDLKFESETYIELVLEVSAFNSRKSFSQLAQSVNNTYWVVLGKAADVNAYSNPLRNSIEFPAGMLQGVFFDPDRPHYMNYGAFGFVIGHEIMHGFDLKGCEYDKYGNQFRWWTNSTEENFIQRAKCIINQYSNYTIPELDIKLDGKATVVENIADNGGLKMAYQAYNNWTRMHGPEPTLPGLEYTPNQMFWISAGNSWCTKHRIDFLRRFIQTQCHTIGNYRILGTLTNMDEFARDFNCPVESKMNPKNKCTVW